MIKASLFRLVETSIIWLKKTRTVREDEMTTRSDLYNCIEKLQTRLNENRLTMRSLDQGVLHEEDVAWMRSVLETSVARKHRILAGLAEMEA